MHSSQIPITNFEFTISSNLILVKRYFGGALVDTVDSHGRNEFNKFANFFQDIQNGNDEYEY